MPTSDAQVRANQANALKSTGPKTSEGKENSRRNSFKHGMTGGGVVVPVEDEAEVKQRVDEFVDELRPSSSLGLALVRRAAGMAVRMERCAERELAAITDRVIQALVDFEAPEGMDDAEVAQFRVETARLAAFDTSKEACLARRYEAAAERSFYRALKEFRLVEKEAKRLNPTPEIAPPAPRLGSFLPAEPSRPIRRSEPAREPVRATSTPPAPTWNPGEPLWEPAFGTGCDLPFAIGKAR